MRAVTGEPGVYHVRPVDPAPLDLLAGLLRVRVRVGDRRCPVIEPTGEIETLLPDLAGRNLADLPGLRELAAARERLVAQVEKPRPNIGSDPPGRAD